MKRLSTMGRCRVGLGILFAFALVAGARGQASFGMSMVLKGAEETAGASAGAHTVKVRVVATGGNANVSSGDATTGSSVVYEWRVYTTFSGGATSVRYGASSVPEGSTLLASYSAPATEANGTFTFSLPPSTTLGAPFKVLIAGRMTTRDWGVDSTTGMPYTLVDWSYQDVAYASYRLRGFPLEAVAVDSRKTYAPPNKDGAYPAVDANADLRPVGFAGWAYRGGLFVGNAAGVHSDQSGVARIQCQATDPGGLPPSLYTLSLLHIGTPAYFRAGSNQWIGGMRRGSRAPDRERERERERSCPPRS